MSESLKLVAGDNGERRREAATLVWKGTPVHRILKLTVLPEMGMRWGLLSLIVGCCFPVIEVLEVINADWND
ncbi:hypothetical protein KY290_038046 [Solanum tuberosum]|uniref:Uncharacterized protein n=1 Tax=Solanum tuberosum TaxID=4113 RepID=A0ABQ7TXR5_SOLTU|nr:hypothetical protein KY284_034925 [Solanum tuberosum]KAH0640797.1 hypothetical protein KY285_037383 [Solanum tuberosum]KAH0739341.1 hypothetical protein KY290_038046 [Solanum tuberosum]